MPFLWPIDGTPYHLSDFKYPIITIHIFTVEPDLERRMSAKFFLLLFFIMSLIGCGGGSPANSPVPSWQREAANPLIVPKATATTVDFGPADSSVLFDTEDNLWKAWFSSTLQDVASGSDVMTIKYAESSDGIAWSEPVVAFQASADTSAWDYTHAETPAVIKNPDPLAPVNQKFILWYSGANKTLAASENRPGADTDFPYYQIGLAYSADGKSFVRYTPGLNNKPGLVFSANASLFGSGLPGVFGDGLVADPEVIYYNNMFHMWFSSFAESVPSPVAPTGRLPLAFGIAHATSTDGINWSSTHDNPLSSLAKPGEVAAGQQPTVFFNAADSQFEMWFSNDTDVEKRTVPCNFNAFIGFWRATSADGINWTPDYTTRDFSYDNSLPYEELGFLTGVEVVMVNGIRHAYYSSWGTEQIPNNPAYLCPDHVGGVMPAVLTFSRISFRT